MHISLDGFVAGPNDEMNPIKVDEELFDHVGKRICEGDTSLYRVIIFAKQHVGGNFVWTPPNYDYPSAHLIPSQVVIKQNKAVTKSYRLNNNESIS